MGQESASAASAGAGIGIRYTAMDVNLVLAPPRGQARADGDFNPGDDQRAGNRRENGRRPIDRHG